MFDLSWIGRLSAVKMKILRRLCFFFQNVIIFIPTNILNKIQNLINNFVWQGKKPRIKMMFLKQQPQYDGLAMPNMNLNNHVAMLVSIMQWWKMRNKMSAYGTKWEWECHYLKQLFH